MKPLLQPFNNKNNSLNLFSSHSKIIKIIHCLLLQPFGSNNSVKTIPPLNSMVVKTLEFSLNFKLTNLKPS